MGKKKTQQQKIGGAGKAPRSYYSDLFAPHEDDHTKSVEEVKGDDITHANSRSLVGLRE